MTIFSRPVFTYEYSYYHCQLFEMRETTCAMRSLGIFRVCLAESQRLHKGNRVLHKNNDCETRTTTLKKVTCVQVLCIGNKFHVFMTCTLSITHTQKRLLLVKQRVIIEAPSAEKLNTYKRLTYQFMILWLCLFCCSAHWLEILPLGSCSAAVNMQAISDYTLSFALLPPGLGLSLVAREQVSRHRNKYSLLRYLLPFTNERIF